MLKNGKSVTAMNTKTEKPKVCDKKTEKPIEKIAKTAKPKIPMPPSKGVHQQREANHKGFVKEEEVSRVLSGFSLALRPRKIQTFFPNLRLILASVYNSNHVSVKQ